MSTVAVKAKRAWFLFQMWTGIISLEGLEYWALAPLTVIVVVGLPLVILNWLFTMLFALLSSTLSSAPAGKI